MKSGLRLVIAFAIILISFLYVLCIAACETKRCGVFLSYEGEANGRCNFCLVNSTADKFLLVPPMYPRNGEAKVPGFNFEERIGNSWYPLDSWHRANLWADFYDDWNDTDCFRLEPQSTCSFSFPVPPITNFWRIGIGFEIYAKERAWGCLIGCNKKDRGVACVRSSPIAGKGADNAQK